MCQRLVLQLSQVYEVPIYQSFFFFMRKIYSYVYFESFINRKLFLNVYSC